MADNKPLGEICVDMGFASREQIIECLNMQTEIHQKGLDRVMLGSLLIKTGYLTSTQLDKALVKQMKHQMPN
jgi:hypothetical protein